MRLRTKWLLSSIGGAVVVTVALLFLPDVLFTNSWPLFDRVLGVVLWPVALCEYLVSPGPTIGRPNQHLHEGTPLDFPAAVVGAGLSWIFWSSLVFVAIRYRRRRGSLVDNGSEVE